jgi:hypothetical protein
MTDTWVDDVGEGDEEYFAATQNGWSCERLGVDWLERVFDRYTKEEAGNRRRLLIVDGYSSHVNMAFIRKADELRILLLVLPPHSTHRLQPLDVGLFQPLSRAYSKHLDNWMHDSLAWFTMSKRYFWSIFKAAWEDSFTSTNILHTFEKTDIFPINSSKILTIIQKKEEPEGFQKPGTPLSCRGIRSLQRDLYKGTPSKAAKAAQRLGHIAYKLAAIVEVERYINRGLHKILQLEKRRRQKGKRLNLLGDEATGPVFFSPSKVQRAKALQEEKEAGEQLRKDQLAEKRAQQAVRKLEREQEKAERAVQRQVHRKEVEAQKAQKAIEIQARKELREAERTEKQQCYKPCHM